MGGCTGKVKLEAAELATGNPQYDGIAPGRETKMNKRGSRRNSILNEDTARGTFKDIIRVDVMQERVALVTLLGGESEDTFTWGTRICEHRINPLLIDGLNFALDKALEMDQVSAVVVTGEGKFFSNGMDLKWIDANQSGADKLQKDAELLLSRILTFPLPTIAAVNGHFCAAGAMLGLAFDFRVMNSEKGLFFVPGVDLGLVYSRGMTELMKAKTPVHMHNDMIVFGTKYTAKDLEKERIVHRAVAPASVVPVAVEHGLTLSEKGRFAGAKYRSTMQNIKKNTYRAAFEALTNPLVEGMGFDDGNWDEHGRAKL